MFVSDRSRIDTENSDLELTLDDLAAVAANKIKFEN